MFFVNASKPSSVCTLSLSHKKLSANNERQSFVVVENFIRSFIVWRCDVCLMYTSVRLFSCSQMAANCGQCRVVESVYGCGWCASSGTCTVRNQCADRTSWITRDGTCPDPVVTRVSLCNCNWTIVFCYLFCERSIWLFNAQNCTEPIGQAIGSSVEKMLMGKNYTIQIESKTWFIHTGDVWISFNLTSIYLSIRWDKYHGLNGGSPSMLGRLRCVQVQSEFAIIQLKQEQNISRIARQLVSAHVIWFFF